MECTACMKEIPEESRYCMYCGTFVEKTSTTEEEYTESFEDRVPCSDGTCIGTIEQGKCTICGKPYSEEAS
ncbi:MAG: zinc ribbon domain-containing protein [Deltaproteobacteria bacterium]|nr:zinc ribbon domain-containing protein [Deltaproteobacteria bacterium]